VSIAAYSGAWLPHILDRPPGAARQRAQQIAQIIKKCLSQRMYFSYLGPDIVEKGAGSSKAKKQVTGYRHAFF
jgi:hypothetical protein